MKSISIVLYLMLCVFYVKAQENKQKNVHFNSGNHSNALVYFNGSIFGKGLYYINPDTIGTFFAEGDSIYVSRTHGTHKDTTLIHYYFGKQRNRGILFVYTRDKVATITQKQFLQYLDGKSHKMLFKINNEPLTNKYHTVDADKIQMVKNFTLPHWDSGEVDTFILFVIKTNENANLNWP